MAIVIKEIIVKTTVERTMQEVVPVIPEEWIIRLKEEILREMERKRLPGSEKKER